MKNGYTWKIGSPLPRLGEHSFTKHRVFEEYVGIYIERLTRRPSQRSLRLTIVDGFCGGGIYSQGDDEVDGSPLRLLTAIEASDRALQSSRRNGFSLLVDFFFIDENPNHVKFLVDALIKRGYASRFEKDIFIRCGDFDEWCQHVIKHVRDKGTAHRSLFILDQYGWSDVRFATIRNILRQLKKPEILLTFAVDALINYLSENTNQAQSLLNIEMAREDVRDLIALKGEHGWRYLIQNGLYRHIQSRTAAEFYTPFFIRSVDANRSYWLLHLSNHRQARDEMGKLHWRLTNSFAHYGTPGFHSLGYDPAHDLRQGLLPFMFDDGALARSQAAVMEDIPRLIAAENAQDAGLSMEALFVRNCNDTPVTSDILAEQLIRLRNEGEVTILSKDGSQKSRAKKMTWDDRVICARQGRLFLPPKSP